jgi:uncharacterized protein (DUF58 family)
VVIFAAINTSNNLLYMVLSAMLAVLLLSGFLSALNFARLELDVRIPRTSYAGESFPIGIRMKNEKRFFPSFSLQFEAPPAETAAPPHPTTGRLHFPAFYVPIIHAQKSEFQSGQATFLRRGRYEVKRVKAASRYPFGFFAKDKMFKVEAECICYPEIMPYDGLNFSTLDILGLNPRQERGPGNDLYMIRNYVQSDSARHVHWKASAKTATLKTREYASEESRRVVLAFDRFARSGDSEQFERLVSYTASAAFHMTNDGFEVALISDDWQSAEGSAEAVLESVLIYLAVVEMSDTAPRPMIGGDEATLTLSLR